MPIQIICFPHAGGSAGGYYWLKQQIEKKDADISVFIYEYRGHGRRHDMSYYKDMEEATESISKDLWESGIFDYKETILFGHSMGAYIAVEIANILLHRYQYQVKTVIVSGQDSPLNMTKDYADSDNSVMIPYLYSLGGMDSVIMENKEYLDFFLEPIRADMKILCSYHPEPKNINTPVYVMYGTGDDEIERKRLPLWNTITSKEVKYKSFAGGHFYLMDQKEETVLFISRILDEIKTVKEKSES